MPPKLLILEPDPSLQEVFTTIFTQQGYQVSICHFTSPAVSQPYPQAVLLDHSVGFNGIHLCRQLRANNVTRHLLIVVLSVMDVDRQQVLDAGADAFIGKPFKLDHFTANDKSMYKYCFSRIF